MSIVGSGPLAQAGGSNTVTVGELFEAARAEGQMHGFVSTGTYEVEVDRVDVVGDALRPRYRIVSGESAGERFTGTRWNLTPKGVRRFKKLCNSWGVQPSPESTLDEIAAALAGRRAQVKVTEESYRESSFYDVQVLQVLT